MARLLLKECNQYCDQAPCEPGGTTMNILAALDSSPQADNVLDKAITLAKQDGSSLTVLTVSEDFIDIADFMDSASLSERLLEKAQETVAQYRAKAAAQGVQVKALALRGVSPAEIIVQTAQDIGAGLIVMGSKSRSGMDRFLIGSVVSKVVAHAPCSVFVVR
jgi:nucleotide-binding universal stress UspA family protein